MNAERNLTPWSHAARLVARWVEKGERVDALLDTIPKSVGGVERGRCQNLFLGAVRHRGRVEAHLKELITLTPRPRVQGILLVAGFELIEGGTEGHAARVGHHAVEQTKLLASPSEARLVNAVVRKLASGLGMEKAPTKQAAAEELAVYFSHPEWLVKRWLAQFGPEPTRALLEWNQKPAPVYARWRNRERAPGEEELGWLTSTTWTGFYEVKQGHWPQVEAALAAGLIYLQDPATRLAVELLELKSGESVLDMCAAPGGKSLAIADALGSGQVVAVDLPGVRVDRLKENLGRVAGVTTALVQGDILVAGTKIFEGQSLPTTYAAVLIDVPCSNTGVMRHRADVKWRLQAGDFGKHANQQLALLSAASEIVAAGGRIVYSTCSLDEDENEEVVQAFLKTPAGGSFTLEKTAISKPWESGHDGAAAFLLRRKS
ncbi:MAG: RsmB/NOP family class I SAM-dependent RNA methyltransferase [Nibricoccus sp.]